MNIPCGNPDHSALRGQGHRRLSVSVVAPGNDSTHRDGARGQIDGDLRLSRSENHLIHPTGIRSGRFRSVFEVIPAQRVATGGNGHRLLLPAHFAGDFQCRCLLDTVQCEEQVVIVLL